MSHQVYQLTQLSCTMCGQIGVSPRTETYHDRFANEQVTEAVWICPRCGNKFNSGIIDRVKLNEKQQ